MQWKGFESPPDGCLLEQIIDLNGEMGIAYERSCQFYKDFHVHDRILMVFPRDSCEMRVGTQSPEASYRIDGSQCLLVPANLEHDDEGISAIYDTFALLPASKFVQEVGRRAGFSELNIEQFLKHCLKIDRTELLEQLIQHYFFERVVARRADSDEAEYLEKKIISELLSICFGRKQIDFQGTKRSRDASIAVRALKFIESNLFKKMDSKVIAKNSGASVSSVFREFKKETGQSPSEYIRNRRLEEAMLLLKKSDRPIGEVALLIGYENFGAFSEAFKAKYKKSPSAFLK